MAVIVGAPHRGRALPLTLAINCPHCGASIHRHITETVNPTGAVKHCPVTGDEYVLMKVAVRKAVAR